MSIWGDITGALGSAVNWVGNEVNQGAQAVEHGVESLFGGGGNNNGGGGAPQGGGGGAPQAPQQNPQGFYPSIQQQIDSVQQQAQQQQQQQQQQQATNNKKNPKKSIAENILDDVKNAIPGGNQLGQLTDAIGGMIKNANVQDIPTTHGADVANEAIDENVKNPVANFAAHLGATPLDIGQTILNSPHDITQGLQDLTSTRQDPQGMLSSAGEVASPLSLMLAPEAAAGRTLIERMGMGGLVNGAQAFAQGLEDNRDANTPGDQLLSAAKEAAPSAIFGAAVPALHEGVGAIKSAANPINDATKANMFRTISQDGKPGVADTAYQNTVKNGGVTINLDGNQPAEGYAYSPFKDAETVVPKTEFTPQHVTDFMNQNADRLSQSGNHLGLWEDDGKIYMDVSQVGPPTQATIDAAEKNGQLAVFDLKNFNEIPTKLKGAPDGEKTNLNPVGEKQDTGASSPGSNASPGEVPRGQEQGVQTGQVNPEDRTSSPTGPAQIPYTEDSARLERELHANSSAAETTPATMEELEKVIAKHRDLLRSTEVSPEMKAATQAAIDRDTAIREDPRQQTQNKVELKANNAKSVIAETEGIRNERLNRFNKGVLQGLKLNKEQLVKLDDALRGKETGDAKVDAVAAKLHDAYDYSLAADRAAGGRTMRYNEGKYSPLYFKADKARMDELGVPENQRFFQNGEYTGFKDQSRYYRSYEEAAQRDGLERLNNNALQDAITYATHGDHAISHNMLYQGLKRVAPEDVASERGNNGTEQLTPAARGALPFYATKAMNKVLMNYKSSELDHSIGETALKAAEAGAKASRKVAFLAAPVHYFNVGTNYAGTMLTNLHPIKMFTDPMRAALGATSSRFYQAELERADKAGTRDFNRHLGIVERPAEPDALHKSGATTFKMDALKVDQKSVFARSMRAMNRFTNILSWKLGELSQKAGVEAGSENGAKVAGEINKVLDTFNSKMEGINPVGERLGTSGSLAPHWIRANVALVKDSLTKGGHLGGMDTPGGIARSAVVGKRALEGAVAIIGSSLVAGQMPNFQQALSEAGLLPNNPIPNFQFGDKNTDNKPVVTNLPTDMIGMVAQMASLLTGDPHFLTARETPILSAITQAITNKDWTGNQLVDKSQPGWEGKMVEKFGQNLLPFMAQNALNPKLTPAQMAEAAIGMRTHRDPNDPQYKAAVAYGQAKDAAINDSSLGEHDKDVLKAFFSHDIDENGQTLLKGPMREQSDAKSLFADDKARQALQKQMQGLDGHDPIFNLSDKDLKTFYLYQSQTKGSSEQEVIKMNNPWLSDVESQRSDYFSSLHLDPSKAVADPNDPPVQYPLSKEEGALMAQGGKITDPTAKTQFYADHPELVDIEQKYGQYVNAVRGKQGAQPLAFTAAPDAQTAADLKAYNGLPQHDGKYGGNATRAQFLNAHPDVKNYFTQSAYNSLLRLAGIAEANSGNAGDKQQQLLKDIKNVGSMDIGKAADGSLALGGMGAGGSSGGSSKFTFSSKGKSGGGSSKGVSMHIRLPKLKIQYRQKPKIVKFHASDKSPRLKMPPMKHYAAVAGTQGGPTQPKGTSGVKLKSNV